MPLTKEQYELNQRRIKEQQHSRYDVDIALNSDLILKDFAIYQNVLRPETTSGFYLARFLASNISLYKWKDTIDMGCGSGIQGIVMALLGAKSVTFSDIAPEAVANTRENVKRFDLTEKSSVVQGDLFENIKSSADVIVFNHPFFSANPLPDVPVTLAFYDSGDLIHKFLDNAPRYLSNDGYILMPYFQFAGETNDPEKQAPKHGYEVSLLYRIDIDDEKIQKGIFSVYMLKPINK